MMFASGQKMVNNGYWWLNMADVRVVHDEWFNFGWLVFGTHVTVGFHGPKMGGGWSNHPRHMANNESCSQLGSIDPCRQR